MDFNEINKFLLKRTNVYRNYVIVSTTADEEKFAALVADFFDDMRDDLRFWEETLINSDYKIPAVVEKNWDILSKEIYKTIDVITKIKELRGF